ncbi:MAG: alpha/beta fold hydrolase [Rhodocyclaceae bacterium]|jgi:dipeptidyl aminopeptidase/acylaminoacyl peptidase|nr:alpha/beta fold hydrolase [Rhodocyclaceae bacterium]
MRNFMDILRSSGVEIGGLAAFIALLAVLRRAVHRSLAPERIVEARTPADVGLPYCEVTIPTENGKFLFGWCVSARRQGRRPAVVAIHGWGGNAETLLPLAQPLHEAGFAVLLIDARCHGRSDEDSFASMPRFAEDLGHAIDWLKRRDDIDPEAIAVIGHSVGAAASLLAASRRQDIAAVVSIAAFAHPVAMMRRWFAAKRIPYLPVGWVMLRYVERVIGHRFDDIAPINTIRCVRCPTLLVHGGEDATVPVGEAHALHAARSGEHVQLKVVAGSHDDYADLDRELPVLVDFLTGVVINASEANLKNNRS